LGTTETVREQYKSLGCAGLADVVVYLLIPCRLPNAFVDRPNSDVAVLATCDPLASSL
jgi:hypothetical protein